MRLFSAWRHVKLMEVTISPDAEDAYARGHITLIEKGYTSYRIL